MKQLVMLDDMRKGMWADAKFEIRIFISIEVYYEVHSKISDELWF